MLLLLFFWLEVMVMAEIIFRVRASYQNSMLCMHIVLKLFLQFHDPQILPGWLWGFPALLPWASSHVSILEQCVVGWRVEGLRLHLIVHRAHAQWCWKDHVGCQALNWAWWCARKVLYPLYSLFGHGPSFELYNLGGLVPLLQNDSWVPWALPGLTLPFLPLKFLSFSLFFAEGCFLVVPRRPKAIAMNPS